MLLQPLKSVKLAALFYNRQKSTKIDKTQLYDLESMMVEAVKLKRVKERGGALVFVLLWLWIRGVMAVGFLATHIYNLYLANDLYRNTEITFSALAWLLNLLQVLGAVGLLRWKRWGLTLLIAVLLVNAGLDFATSQIMSLLQNVTLCAGLIWLMHEKMHHLE
ncbi:MAG: hypothetical protein Q9P44_06895 [Anaerolineae bacterium]|nr:hypothetical protein [Anaerolineae bacterium]